MKNQILGIVAVGCGFVLSACGASVNERVSKAIFALQSAAQNQLAAQQQQFSDELVERFSGGCTGSEAPASSCTPSPFDSGTGCTITGSSSSATLECTLSSDRTACCGDTPFTIHSGSTSRLTFSNVSSSRTGGFGMTLGFRMNGTVSGDGLTNQAVECDFSSTFGFRLQEFLTEYQSANVATMSCEQQVSWLRRNLQRFFTIETTCVNAYACKIGTTEVACATFAEDLGRGRSACNRGGFSL